MKMVKPASPVDCEYVIVAPYREREVVVSGGVVTVAPPELPLLAGMTLNELAAYCARHGWVLRPRAGD